MLKLQSRPQAFKQNWQVGVLYWGIGVSGDRESIMRAGSYCLFMVLTPRELSGRISHFWSMQLLTFQREEGTVLPEDLKQCACHLGKSCPSSVCAQTVSPHFDVLIFIYFSSLSGSGLEPISPTSPLLLAQLSFTWDMLVSAPGC